MHVAYRNISGEGDALIIVAHQVPGVSRPMLIESSIAINLSILAVDSIDLSTYKCGILKWNSCLRVVVVTPRSTILDTDRILCISKHRSIQRCRCMEDVKVYVINCY